MNEERFLYNYPSKYSKNKLKVLLYYPNNYYAGMSNLGFQTIFHKLKQNQEVYCERGFYPDIKSYENNLSFNEFDIIIFSISFEIDFLNIIEILLKTGISIYKKDRKRPFIAAGGIAITLNPYILKDIFDVEFIGEGEELIDEFIYTYLNDKDFNDIKGIFLDNQNISKRKYKGDYVCHSVMLTKKTEFSNSLLIEIARGCPFSCKFCAVSYNYKPFRPRKLKNILEILNNFKEFYKKAGIISSNVCSHPDFLKICDFLLKNNKKFSISSLRLDTLNDEIVKILKRGGITTFTVAIEAGSEKLRKIINKKLTDEHIFEAIELFVKNRILNLKFYFMIGIPFEEFQDIEQIVVLIKKIKIIYLANKNYLKHFGKFTISINPFIPKRETPFFDYNIDTIDNLKIKQNFLKRELSKIPNVKVIFENIYNSYLQSYLSKFDHKFLPLLIEKVEKGISNKKFIDKVNEIYY